MVGRWMGWIDYYLKEIRRAREWAKRRRAWMRFDGEVEMFWLICSLLHFSFSCWCFQNLVYRSSCWSATSDSDFIVKSSTIHYCLVFSLHFLFRTWSVKQSRSFARVLLLFWSHLIELSVDFFLASLSHSIYTLIRVSTCRHGKWKWIDRRYKFITHSAWSILILIQFSLVSWMLCCWLRTNGFNVKSAKSVIHHHRRCQVESFRLRRHFLSLAHMRQLFLRRWDNSHTRNDIIESTLKIYRNSTFLVEFSQSISSNAILSVSYRNLTIGMSTHEWLECCQLSELTCSIVATFTAFLKKNYDVVRLSAELCGGGKQQQESGQANADDEQRKSRSFFFVSKKRTI